MPKFWLPKDNQENKTGMQKEIEENKPEMPKEDEKNKPEMPKEDEGNKTMDPSTNSVDGKNPVDGKHEARQVEDSAALKDFSFYFFLFFLLLDQK